MLTYTPPAAGAVSQGATKFKQFETTTAQQVYTPTDIGAADLVNAALLQVFYDGKLLQNVIAPFDYTFDTATGNLTFVIIVNTGVAAGVLYQLPL